MSSPFQVFSITANRHSINKVQTSVGGGRVVDISFYGNNIGIVSPKGAFLAFYKGHKIIAFGRDAVARLVNEEVHAYGLGKTIKYAALARLAGLVDVAQFAVTGPLALAVHSVIFIGTGVATVVTSPLAISEKTRNIPKVCGTLAVSNLISVGATGAGMVIAPLEIVVPELNIKLLKSHKWVRLSPSLLKINVFTANSNARTDFPDRDGEM